MNQQQFQRELEFGVAISIATSLLQCQLITPNEFSKLKAVLIKKHSPVISSLQETVPGNLPPTSDLIPEDSNKKTASWVKHLKKGKEEHKTLSNLF